eukprot:460294_1
MQSVFPKIKTILQSYDIDTANGFLRDKEPLRSIPLDKYPKYSIWEQIMSELPQLIVAQSFKLKLESMPTISNISDLLSAPLEIKRRALSVLSFFANAFMNEKQIIQYTKPNTKPKPRQYLPECIAIPLYQLCKDMNAPPVIRHCHMVVSNWRLLIPPFDFTKRHKVNNIALNNLFLGGMDENWFFLIGFGIESHAGTILTSILSIQEYIQMLIDNISAIESNVNEIIKSVKYHLSEIIVHIGEMSKLLLRYYEKLDGHIFYKRVRIFLTGCESEEDFPNGVELKGVPKSSIPLSGTIKVDNKRCEYLCLRYNGASAAQAAGFPVIDNFLNVDHSSDEFLTLMSKYIPFEHRKFIYWMRDERLNMIECINMLKKQTFINENDIKEIMDLYDKCVAKQRKFRITHMKIVKDMIVKPAAALAEKTKGTGGSTLIPYLKSVLDRTRNKTSTDIISKM